MPGATEDIARIATITPRTTNNEKGRENLRITRLRFLALENAARGRDRPLLLRATDPSFLYALHNLVTHLLFHRSVLLRAANRIHH